MGKRILRLQWMELQRGVGLEAVIAVELRLGLRRAVDEEGVYGYNLTLDPPSRRVRTHLVFLLF